MTLPLARILHAVSGEPRTPGELARALGSSEAALSGMLATLHRGGSVQEAVPDRGACACGPCALKSLCRNADGADATDPGGLSTDGSTTATDQARPAPPLSLLRLIARGVAYLARHRAGAIRPGALA